LFATPAASTTSSVALSGLAASLCAGVVKRNVPNTQFFDTSIGYVEPNPSEENAMSQISKLTGSEQASFSGRALDDNELDTISGGDMPAQGFADKGIQSLTNALISNLAGALQVGGQRQSER